MFCDFCQTKQFEFLSMEIPVSFQELMGAPILRCKCMLYYTCTTDSVDIVCHVYCLAVWPNNSPAGPEGAVAV